MKTYPVNSIRNVAILGHGGDGKTSLTEGILYFAGQTDRLGKTADGNTVSDFDPEEIRRQISISASIAPVEYDGHKINLIDTPGYFDFAGEIPGSLFAAESGIIVVSGKSGVEVGTEKAWKACLDHNLARLIFISKMDEENADFYKVVEDLRKAFGISVCPIAIPMYEKGKITGLVNCADMSARKFENGKVIDCPLPTDMDDKINPVREMLMESIAETSEELMEKFFAGEAFTPEEIKNSIKMGVKEGSIVPVICGSAISGLGMQTVLYNIIKYFPSPDESSVTVIGKNGEETKLPCDPSGPVVIRVFKTVADQFVGKMSYFKVLSGTLKNDMTLIDVRTQNSEKISKLFFVRGKKQIEAAEIIAGDIGVVTKLANVKTGDALCAQAKPVDFAPIEFPKPCLSYAILPKAKGDEEKIATGIYKLIEEDPTLSTYTNTETHQQIVSGIGDMHIDVMTSKLKNKFGVEVELKEPRVPYRETIHKKVKVQGRHKKQSGGHGQYGDVWVEFEPQFEQDDLIFEEKVFGGAVPKNYFPAVEKGLRESIKKGVLAGYPVVHLKATLVDGSYHPVDSSEMAFKIAASLAYKTGLAQAGASILEPIGKLEVHIPEGNMGDIIGDINKRRGRVLGMNSDKDGLSVVEAVVPMAQMHTYAIELRSMTRGRGYFNFTFESYEEAPPQVAQKVIEDAKQNAEDEAE